MPEFLRGNATINGNARSLRSVRKKGMKLVASALITFCLHLCPMLHGEELQSVEIEFNRTPRVDVDQVAEMLGQLGV